MTYATRKTPDVVAPTIARVRINVQNSGATAASNPNTTCITRDIKNMIFLPYLNIDRLYFKNSRRNTYRN